MKFTTITTNQMVKLMSVEVDEYMISKESMNKIEEILKLNGMNSDNLTATRNSIVKTFVEMIDEAREENDWSMIDTYNIKMSGIVAVIDNKLFEMGALY